MIQTNKIKCTYFPDAINRDFYFIKLNARERDRDGTPKFVGYVDFYEALENTPGVAALVGNGKYWYMLIDKQVITQDGIIQSLSQHQELQTMEILPAQIVKDDEYASIKNNENSLYGYFVVQLVLDLLGYRHFSIKKYQFSNIASALLLIPKDTTPGTTLDVWWIRLTRNWGLSISKTRMVRGKELKYIRKSTNPLFTINSATRTLKSISRNTAQQLMDRNEPVYEWHNPFDTRPVVPFADLEDPLSDQTRIGIFADVFSLIEQQLGAYVHIKHEPFGPWQMIDGLQVHKKPASRKAKQEHNYEGRAIELIGEVSLSSSPEDREAETKLRELLSAKGLRITKKADLGIEIVPSPKNLTEDDEDPYEQKRGIQHITDDTLTKADLDSIITKILFELAVKKDCMEKRLNFGKELALSDSYRVGLFVQKAKKNRKQRAIPELIHIPVLDVFPDGTIQFQTLYHDESLLIQLTDFDRYVHSFTQAIDQNFMQKAGFAPHQLIGFVENSRKEITLLAQTDYCSLMNMDVLRSRGEQLARPLPEAWTTFAGIGAKLAGLKDEASRSGASHRERAWEAARERVIAFFTLDHGSACIALAEPERADTARPKVLPAKLKSWIAAFQTDPRAPLDKDTLRFLLNAQFGAASRSRDFVHEVLDQDGVLLNMPRSREAKHRELSFKTGLQVCQTKIQNKSVHYYFTGYPVGAAIKTTIARASIIRIAFPAGNHEPFFEALAPTFLPWIRVDEGTVLPGAFKYLREYAIMEGVALKDAQDFL